MRGYSHFVRSCAVLLSQWAVLPSSKLTTYFNPLDGSYSNSPIERERELSASVYARFALGGALCNVLAEGGMLPIYASKVLAQAEPQKYPEVARQTIEARRRIACPHFADPRTPAALTADACARRACVRACVRVRA
jgi:hypothetical protein